ncbi:MAG: hypothetical protein H0W07_02635 [Chloroflexi bacterium]|nr:hypothetical protein [Chloroflexota bacterium]
MEYRLDPVAAPVCRVDPWPAEVVEFVRHAYRRRPVGWPELYDELTRMASRGTFRGLGFAELAELGLSFSLSELPKLAQLSIRVAAEEQLVGVTGSGPSADEEDVTVPVTGEQAVRFSPQLVRRVPPQLPGAGPRLTVVRGGAPS